MRSSLTHGNKERVLPNSPDRFDSGCFASNDSGWDSYSPDHDEAGGGRGATPNSASSNSPDSNSPDSNSPGSNRTNPSGPYTRSPDPRSSGSNNPASSGATSGLPIVDVVTRLADLPIDALDTDGVIKAGADIQSVATWLTLKKSALAARAEKLREQGKPTSAASALSGGGKRSNRRTKEDVRRTETVNTSPALQDAMADGHFNPSHADALAAARNKAVTKEAKQRFADSEAELINTSRTLTADEFARKANRQAELANEDDGLSQLAQQIAASKGSIWRDRFTGMFKLYCEIDPERGAHIETVIRHEVNRLWHLANDGPPPANKLEQLTAQALYNLITNQTPNSTTSSGIDISVLIDLKTLLGGLHKDSVSETENGTPLPPETIRRYACNNNIIPIVLNGDGVTLDLGRKQRLANRNQRRALRAMYNTCADTNCDTPYTHCQIHHIQTWTADQGPTDLANLIPVCTNLHHQLHEGGWTATLDHNRTLHLYGPDGELHSTHPLPNNTNTGNDKDDGDSDGDGGDGDGVGDGSDNSRDSDGGGGDSDDGGGGGPRGGGPGGRGDGGHNTGPNAKKPEVAPGRGTNSYSGGHSTRPSTGKSKSSSGESTPNRPKASTNNKPGSSDTRDGRASPSGESTPTRPTGKNNKPEARNGKSPKSAPSPTKPETSPSSSERGRDGRGGIGGANGRGGGGANTSPSDRPPPSGPPARSKKKTNKPTSSETTGPASDQGRPDGAATNAAGQKPSPNQPPTTPRSGDPSDDGYLFPKVLRHAKDRFPQASPSASSPSPPATPTDPTPKPATAPTSQTRTRTSTRPEACAQSKPDAGARLEADSGTLAEPEAGSHAKPGAGTRPGASARTKTDTLHRPLTVLVDATLAARARAAIERARTGPGALNEHTTQPAKPASESPRNGSNTPNPAATSSPESQPLRPTPTPPQAQQPHSQPQAECPSPTPTPTPRQPHCPTSAQLQPPTKRRSSRNHNTQLVPFAADQPPDPPNHDPAYWITRARCAIEAAQPRTETDAGPAP